MKHVFLTPLCQTGYTKYISAPQQWRYVSANDNPTDLASRGSSADEVLTSSWLTGPRFLWEKEIPPVADVITEIQIRNPEVEDHIN